MTLDYKNPITGGITKAICLYGEANNKYIQDYDETKESKSIWMVFITINSLAWI